MIGWGYIMPTASYPVSGLPLPYWLGSYPNPYPYPYPYPCDAPHRIKDTIRA